MQAYTLKLCTRWTARAHRVVAPVLQQSVHRHHQEAAQPAISQEGAATQTLMMNFITMINTPMMMPIGMTCVAMSSRMRTEP